MTIRKGEPWGTLQRPGAGMTLVTSDAELRAAVLASRAAGTLGSSVFALAGGDMMRTVGGSGDRNRFSGTEPIPHLPVDLVDVVADDSEASVFVAHLTAWRRRWRGRLTAAMNAQFIGSFDVAPRSHPNDGRVDLVEAAADMSLQQRWMAAKRLPLGTHVPHPAISIRASGTHRIEFDRPTPVRLDGASWRTARQLHLNVVPDAITVCV